MQNNSGEPPTVDIFAEPNQAPTQLPPLPTPSESSVANALPQAPMPSETLADIDRKNRANMHSDAQAAVNAAFDSGPQEQPAMPSMAPPVQQLPAQEQSPLPPPPPAGMPPLPDFSSMPQPALPPLPQFGAPPSGGLPPEQLGQIFGSPTLQPAQPAPPNQPADPNQFQIPSQ